MPNEVRNSKFWSLKKTPKNIWHWFEIDDIGNQCLFWWDTNVRSYWWQIDWEMKAEVSGYDRKKTNDVMEPQPYPLSSKKEYFKRMPSSPN